MSAKSKLIIIIVLLVLFTSLLWFYYASHDGLPISLVYPVAGVLILVSFAVYTAFRRISSERKGQPGEDELSKLFLQKAAASSFYVSIYLWLGISVIADEWAIEAHTAIMGGILTMMVVFAISWLYHKMRKTA